MKNQKNRDMFGQCLFSSDKVLQQLPKFAILKKSTKCINSPPSSKPILFFLRADNKPCLSHHNLLFHEKSPVQIFSVFLQGHNQASWVKASAMHIVQEVQVKENMLRSFFWGMTCRSFHELSLLHWLRPEQLSTCFHLSVVSPFAMLTIQNFVELQKSVIWEQFGTSMVALHLLLFSFDCQQKYHLHK